MKKVIALLLAVMMCLPLCGCFHKHTFSPATCVAAPTCAECGEIEGEPLGHKWQDADCDTPKTCSVCSDTDGEPLGHKWSEADCLTPKTCSVCNATDGELSDHTWLAATCIAPKTCSVCKATEGTAQHTVDAGRCADCGNVINPEFVLEVVEVCSVEDNTAKLGQFTNDLTALTSPSAIYNRIIKESGNLMTIKSRFQRSYDMCKDVRGMEPFSAALKDILDNVPSTIKGNDRTSVLNWIAEYRDWLITLRDSQYAMADFIRTLA